MRVRWTAMVLKVSAAARPRLPRGSGVPPTMASVDIIRVAGGARLVGEVTVGGAKNSALKLMAAALLAPGESVITNVPRITDILIMAEVLRRLGCEVTFEDGVVRISVPDEPGTEADYDLVRR